jgi:hypothetical protein
MMNILARTSWDLVLRVTLCYLVFYSTIYLLMILVNGLSVADMLLHREPLDYGLKDSASITWLKFVCELGARLAPAALLVYFGVPRFRFALMQEGTLYTHFSTLYPRWILPMTVLAIVTFIGQLSPISSVMPLWLLFHAIFAFAVIHYMMHGVAENKKLRLLEEA